MVVREGPVAALLIAPPERGGEALRRARGRHDAPSVTYGQRRTGRVPARIRQRRGPRGEGVMHCGARQPDTSYARGSLGWFYSPLSIIGEHNI